MKGWASALTSMNGGLSINNDKRTGLLEKFSLGDNSVTFSASQYIFFVSTDSAFS